MLFLLEAANAVENTAGKEPSTWLVVGAGIGIVFIGMIILTVILYIMSAIGKKSSGKAEKKPPVEEVKAEVAEEKAEVSDDEIYAVIAAAIAAYESEHGRAPSIKAAQVKRVCKKFN